MYIADTFNNRIRKVLISTSYIITFAGTGASSYSGDNGAATSAALNKPSGVALDSSSNLYFSDNNNQRIRKVTAGVITTIAGTGTQSYSGDNGAATLAELNTPNGIAVDSAGTLLNPFFHMYLYY